MVVTEDGIQQITGRDIIFSNIKQPSYYVHALSVTVKDN